MSNNNNNDSNNTINYDLMFAEQLTNVLIASYPFLCLIHTIIMGFSILPKEEAIAQKN